MKNIYDIRPEITARSTKEDCDAIMFLWGKGKMSYVATFIYAEELVMDAIEIGEMVNFRDLAGAPGVALTVKSRILDDLS